MPPAARAQAGKKMAAVVAVLGHMKRDMESMATQTERAACLKEAKDNAKRAHTEV